MELSLESSGDVASFEKKMQPGERREMRYHFEFRERKSGERGKTMELLRTWSCPLEQKQYSESGQVL